LDVEEVGGLRKDKQIVKEIRKSSEERTQRIVIDEVITDELFRILSAQTKSAGGEADITNESVWGEEEMYHVSRGQLEKLLSQDQMDKIREGQVFYVEKEGVKEVHEDIRTHVKARAKEILDWEGKSRQGARRSR